MISTSDAFEEEERRNSDTMMNSLFEKEVIEEYIDRWDKMEFITDIYCQLFYSIFLTSQKRFPIYSISEVRKYMKTDDK